MPRHIVYNGKRVTYNGMGLLDPSVTELKFTLNITTDLTFNGVTTGYSEGINYDAIIDWGDGIITHLTGINPTIIHEYSAPGEYDVVIKGIFPYFRFGSADDRQSLIRVDNFGETNWVSTVSTFYDCSKLKTVKGEADFSNIKSSKQMFRGCSGIEYIDAKGWDMRKVTTTYLMFFLVGYDYHAATGNSSELLNLDTWNTSEGALEDTSQTFNSCMITDLDINTWDMRNVITTASMFYNATILENLNIKDWDVGNVENMRSMFQGCRKLETLDIANWDVSNVNDMSLMFRQCYSIVNLDISGWDISNVNTMAQFMISVSTWPTAMYDKALIAWAALPSLQTGVAATFGFTKYSSAAASARQYIIDTYSWTINDSGQA